MNNLIIYCVDIGSERNSKSKFGWANNENKEGSTLEGLKDDINEKLAQKKKITIGFECPLFFELTDNAKEVTKARSFDGNRAMTSNSGACSMVTGIAQIKWLFDNIDKTTIYSLNNWEQLNDDNQTGIYVWEAFISNKNKKDISSDTTDDENRHIEDAKIGIKYFQEKMKTKETSKDVVTRNIFSIINAIILSVDNKSQVSFNEPCFVIKADN